MGWWTLNPKRNPANGGVSFFKSVGPGHLLALTATGETGAGWIFS